MARRTPARTHDEYPDEEYMTTIPRVELEVPEDIRRRWEERGDPIVKYPAEVLRQTAKPVEKPTAATRELVERMKSAMIEARGVGLAAPQMGVSERVIIYQLPEEGAPLRVIINPRIISMKGEQVGPEGCLSIPMLQGDVRRAHEIVVRGIDMLGRPIRRRACEFEARVIQHEVDHLDGILFMDRAEAGTLYWHLPGESEEEEDAALHE
jgi:peptide deformylase